MTPKESIRGWCDGFRGAGSNRDNIQGVKENNVPFLNRPFLADLVLGGSYLLWRALWYLFCHWYSLIPPIIVQATLMGAQTTPLPLDGGILLKWVGDAEINVTILRCSAVTIWACPGRTKMTRQKVCNWATAYNTDPKNNSDREGAEGRCWRTEEAERTSHPGLSLALGTGESEATVQCPDCGFSGPHAGHCVSPQDKQRMDSLPLLETELSPLSRDSFLFSSWYKWTCL